MDKRVVRFIPVPVLRCVEKHRQHMLCAPDSLLTPVKERQKFCIPMQNFKNMVDAMAK